MKIWLVILLLLVPGLASGEDLVTEGEEMVEDAVEGWEGDLPADPGAPEQNWLDESHAYATERAQALTQWMDDYFGDPNYELEAAESFLRLDLNSDWDQDDGNNNRVRLRGKLQLPKISRRLNLVFADESGDEFADRDERRLDDNVGLVYEVSESKRSRFDLTMGLNWNRVRPGVRYRFQDSFGEVYGYRLTQRLQWENDEGFYATSQAQLDRALGENTFLRWNSRVVYGEETKGTEWVTRLSLFERRQTLGRNQEVGVNYFAGLNGVTDPKSYVRNYRVGVQYRRQIYRKFLFLEIEPAYNYRKQDPDDKRQFAWSIGVTLQIALERDLARKKNPSRHKDPADDNIPDNGGE